MAADPGLTALRRAVRTTLSVVCGVFSVYFGLQFLGFGSLLTVAMLGGLVSMIPNIAVNDPNPKNRFITMLLIPIVASCAVFISTLLNSNSILRNAALLVVIFGAYYLRRFGSIFMALGMLSFMTYYFASLVHTKLAQMPLLIVAIVVGISWATFIMFVVLPDKQKQITKRMLNSYYARAAMILDLLYTALKNGNLDKATEKRLQNWIRQLEECAASIQGELPDTDEAKNYKVFGLQPEGIKVLLFDATLAIETIASAIQNIIGNNIPQQQNLLAILQVIRDGFRNRNIQEKLDDINHALDELAQPIHASSQKYWHSVLHQPKRIEAAGRWLIYDIRNIESFKNQPQSAEDKENKSKIEQTDNKANLQPQKPTTPVAKIKSKLDPNTILAIQVTIAGAIGIVIGYLISPSHQYWTVLTAFVVLSNANTIGKTYSRAFQRTLGTLLGAIIGFGIASLVDKSAIIEIVLIFVCIFFGYYLFSFAYGLMIFFITVMLALIYGILLGQIQPVVMLDRFIDTLAGAAIAFIIAALVLPTSSSDEVKQSSSDFLTTVENYVKWYLDSLKNGRTDDLIDEAFEIKNKLKEVRAAINILRKLSGKRVQTRAVQILAAFTAINYYAGHLVVPTVRERKFESDQQMQNLLDEAKAGISSNIEVLISQLRGQPCGRIEDLGDIEDLIENEFKESNSQPIHSKPVSTVAQSQSTTSDSELLNSLHNIWHINQAIVALAIALGAKKQDQEKSAQAA